MSKNMDNHVILATVPHTGTNFMRQVLKEANIVPYHEHFPSVSAFPLCKNQIMICTIRDPKATLITWICRQTFSERITFFKFPEAWKKFNEAFLKYGQRDDFFIIPVDVPIQRDDALSQLSKTLEYQLKVSNFRRKNSKK
jgi:hypothetical protein